MKFGLICFLVALDILHHCVTVVANPTKLNIRHGEDAEDGEFPYMVELRDSEGCFTCGGSIIASNWILTAAHCLESIFGREEYTIVYGTNKLYDCFGPNHNDPSKEIKAKKWYIHPHWSRTNGVPSNDVGLIELEKHLSFEAKVQPVILAEENTTVSNGVLGNLTGWGSSLSGASPLDNLQKISLGILSNEECISRINNVASGIEFNSTQFLCTNDQDNGQCSGDSGSPFVINGVQHGIVSWSLKPCGQYPGTYTRVSLDEHRQWIKNITLV